MGGTVTSQPVILSLPWTRSHRYSSLKLSKMFIGAQHGHAGVGRLALSRFLSAVKQMQPQLRHLRAFLAVADQGSANRAGAALFRAPSAVSRSIHKLEHELGVELFERRARGMLLNEYGRALLVRARRVHAEMQRARTEVAALVEKGRVRNAAIFGMLTHERRVRAF